MENKLSAGSQIPDIDISLINGDSARLSKKRLTGPCLLFTEDFIVLFVKITLQNLKTNSLNYKILTHN